MHINQWHYIQPYSPTTIRVVATGGMADWRITLIVGPERLGMCWRCFRPEPADLRSHGY
jgi:hypothetical protein